MPEFSLISLIIENSVSKIWDSAKLEWSMEDIYDVSDPETCSCGHYPILEICIIKNNNNQKTLMVGNTCVKKFLRLSSDKIFKSKKQVKKDLSKSFNQETVDFCFNKNVINQWQKNFYLDIIKKRSLSDKQLVKKKEINIKMLACFTK